MRLFYAELAGQEQGLAAGVPAVVLKCLEPAGCIDRHRAHQLTELLRAVAVYAAGGLKALQDYSRNAGGKTLLLTRQLGVK